MCVCVGGRGDGGAPLIAGGAAKDNLGRSRASGVEDVGDAGDARRRGGLRRQRSASFGPLGPVVGGASGWRHAARGHRLHQESQQTVRGVALRHRQVFTGHLPRLLRLLPANVLDYLHSHQRHSARRDRGLEQMTFYRWIHVYEFFSAETNGPISLSVTIQ